MTAARELRAENIFSGGIILPEGKSTLETEKGVNKDSRYERYDIYLFAGVKRFQKRSKIYLLSWYIIWL